MNKKKKMIAGVILVVGLGVSVWLWSTVGLGEDKGDATVAGQMLTFTCKNCKKTFSLTVADASAQRRANEGEIICPECKTAGAQKHGVQISVSGDGGFRADNADSADNESPATEQTQEASAPSKPKIAGAGAQKKTP